MEPGTAPCFHPTMSRTARLTLLLAALAASLRAQPAPAPENSPVKNPTTPAEATPPPAPRRRAISPEAAAALAAAAPKYAPPPKPVEIKPVEELPDLRETDKPKNTIIRLPKFIVREPRPPVFTERDLSTNPKGLAQIAMRRYFTEADRAMNRFMLPLFATSRYVGLNSNESRALDLYYEDERLKNMADMSDLSNMVQKSDASSGLYLKREVDKTFLRTSDFGWQGGSPTKNGP